MFVARNSGSNPVRSKHICEYQGVTLRYLEHILQVLVKDGILRGIRGPKGGYLLARDRRKIPLRDIFESVQSIAGDEKEKESNSELKKKIIEPLWMDINDNVKNYLSTLSIQDLCDRAMEKGLAEGNKKSDFNI